MRLASAPCITWLGASKGRAALSMDSDFAPLPSALKRAGRAADIHFMYPVLPVLACSDACPSIARHGFVGEWHGTHGVRRTPYGWMPSLRGTATEDARPVAQRLDTFR
jgi:hypothetical protein